MALASESSQIDELTTTRTRARACLMAFDVRLMVMLASHRGSLTMCDSGDDAGSSK